jgi:hypothetical protein
MGSTDVGAAEAQAYKLANNQTARAVRTILESAGTEVHELKGNQAAALYNLGTTTGPAASQSWT